MAFKATDPACPISAFGLLFMPTARTLATGSSFGASEARDVSLFRFVTQIVNIFAVFPQRHALIVVATSITSADTVRIADEEASYLMLNTEINHPSRGFVSHVPNTSFRTSAYCMLGMLQLLPTTGIFLATGLLPGNLAQSLMALPLEATNAPSSDDQCLACVRADGREMDFTKVYGRMNLTRSLLCLWNFYADMQLKAMVPDQGTCPALGRQVNGKHKRRPSFAHWQNNPSRLFADSLSRPHRRIEPLGFPGILHLGVGRLELSCGLHIGQESMDDQLHGLTMQGKLALGGLLQLMASRPFGMRLTCLFVGFHAQVPDGCRLLLGAFQSVKLPSRQGVKSKDTNGFHGRMIAWMRKVGKWGKPGIPSPQLPITCCGYRSTNARYLTFEVRAETKRLSMECCEHHGLTLLALETDSDHIHVVVSAPPRCSPAMLANLLKGHASRYLREKFPRLKKVCGKDQLGTQRYYVGTAGMVSAETIKRSITDCQGK